MDAILGFIIMGLMVWGVYKGVLWLARQIHSGDPEPESIMDQIVDVLPPAPLGTLWRVDATTKEVQTGPYMSETVWVRSYNIVLESQTDTVPELSVRRVRVGIGEHLTPVQKDQIAHAARVGVYRFTEQHRGPEQRYSA